MNGFAHLMVLKGLANTGLKCTRMKNMSLTADDESKLFGMPGDILTATGGPCHALCVVPPAMLASEI